MMSGPRILLAVVLAAASVAGLQSQTAAPGAPAGGVEQATAYVEAYERAFASLVSEERQVQKLVRADGRVKKTRELKSDFLLVKTSDAWAQVFRDVIAVDGKPVRNREDRLRKLFLDSPKTALEQARAIARESERHNIGMSRTGNSPLLPLIFLHPRAAARSRFVLSGASLTFEEFQTPSVLSARRNGVRADLLARGAFTIDAASSRVLAGEFTALGPPGIYSVSLAVRYADDPQLKLMVPTAARERYWFEDKPKEDHLEVESTYSNFRRFQVTVGEQIKTPK